MNLTAQMNLKYSHQIKHILLVMITVMSLPVFAFESDINRTDAQGQRQGYWIIKGSMLSDATYKPEEKVEEGNYKNNRKDGLWKKYWPGGKLRNEINYVMGKPTGEYKLFYENGKLEEHGFWVNSKNTGDFKRFYQNGNPQQVFTFSDNGKRNGLQKYYHENGKLALEVNIVNGNESGVSKRYNQEGVLIEEKVFENGTVRQVNVVKAKEIQQSKNAAPASDPYDKKIGKSSEVVQDKTNKAQAFKPNGYNTLYDKNGNVTQSGEFNEGRLYDGKWYRYNSNGLLIRVEIYKGGKYIGTGVVSESDQ